METENQSFEKTVGMLLREARLAKGLTLEAVEAATHIYSKNLMHLENDEYDKIKKHKYSKTLDMIPDFIDKIFGTNKISKKAENEADYL